MNNKLYHGSYIRNIIKLDPYYKSHNTIKKPVIYFTKNISLALFYIWNRPYKWVTYYEDDCGKVVFTEEFENHLYDFYNEIGGCVYECDSKNLNIHESQMRDVFVSELPVTVEKCYTIENVYLEILKQESLGDIIIKRFNTLSDIEKEEISKRTIRAIHMEKLLQQTDKEYIRQKSIFVKSKYPKEWNIASKNTNEEINTIINEWRISVGLNPL